MQVRRIQYGSADYRAALELRNRLLRVPLGLDVYQEDLEAERGQWHYVLADGDELAGCVSVVPMDKEHAKIRQMAIDATRQRSGCGRKLLEQVELDLRAEGTRSVALAARREAVGFYERLGYRAVGEEFQEVGIPHVQMEKTIATGAATQP